MGCGDSLSFLRHFLLGIVLGIFNFVSSLINIYYLYKEGHNLYGSISVFLLWFPGLVTSTAFLVLYASGNKTVLNLKRWKLVVYPAGLLLFYPVVPIILTLTYLVTRNEKHHERATMSKFFAGFLDHGPHFVLRLVIVVLVGIAQGGVYQRYDFVFIMSMVSGFGSFILTALWFNERESSWLRWLFLSGPMYSAIFACRSFTLAVFLKETLYDPDMHELFSLLVIVLMFLSNLTMFRMCGQDWTRSSVFGVASLLLPAGYTNDTLYYQAPGQDILVEQNTCRLAHRLRQEQEEEKETEVAFQPETETVETHTACPSILVPMQSAKFLMMHVVINTLLMLVCAVYILFSRHLDSLTDDALVIPQLLGVIPGLFFAIGKCLLMPDTCPDYDDNVTTCQRVCGQVRRGTKVCLAVVFSLMGFMSLVPALFWTFIYKWFTSLEMKTNIL
eukprot:GFUD01002529.1.p1 GENE.GFUD01002529.1~~GFUD01002529.1.p1  ORF type:complete len:445 (-),score=110.94 GFUD01002529.1:454-1788(-)